MIGNLYRPIALIVLLASMRSALIAADPQEIIKERCVACHGPDQQEADLRLDNLPLPSPQSRDAWSAVVRMIKSGEMPPEGEPKLEAKDQHQLIRWIAQRLAETIPQPAAVRRMNRFEYENTVRDLLGIDATLAEFLPEDSSVQGFDNVADGLGISSILLERYLEAANVAFDHTIRRIKPLPPQTRRAVLMESKENIGSVKGKKGGVIQKEGAFVDFTPGWPPARVDAAHPIEPGVYRCRVAVWPVNPGPDRTLSVAVFTGPLFGPGKRHFNGMFDVTGTPEKPRVIEFTTWMQEGHALHILPWIYPEHVTWRDKHEERPGVAMVWAETHGPLDQSFPSESQRKLFGESPSLAMKEGTPFWMRHRKGVKKHFVDSSQPNEDIERIVSQFAQRAFRRPVKQSLADQFVGLAVSRLDDGSSFEEAVRAGVTAVLCSPHFLLLNQEDSVDDYTIASRLSYFLWSSMPDAELLELAAAGQLRDPQVRYAQVERMINDPKIQRFIDSFTGQWLDLREIEFTTPDKTLYPEYDELLLRSMLAETKGFVEHMLKNDLSVLSLIDSDFAILNQRLATHYQIDGIRGHEEFRVVTLPEDSIRGGVLTQASVMKVTANGTTTSPVLRGVWVLDRVLGQPPSPPPPGVPAVEPDIRGAVSIVDQLKRHREDSACARCHRQIDAVGFALEEFDVIGGHRQWYRSLEGKGKRIGNTRYYAGPEVQSSGQLSGGRQFTSFAEFQAHLVQSPEAIAEAMAKKLLIYGSGRRVDLAQQASVDAIVESSRNKGYGLRSIIHAVTDSDLFLSP